MEIELFNDVAQSDKYTQVLTIKVPPLLEPLLATSIDIVAGTAKQWTIGQADWAPFKPRAVNPFVISIPAEVASYLTFDETEMKFTLTADRAIKDAAKSNPVIDVELFNENETTSKFSQTMKIQVPPILSADIDQSVALVVGTAKEWILPAPDSSPYQMDTEAPIRVDIPADIQSYLTFTAQSRTLSWSNNINAMHTVEGKTYTINIKLKNEQGTESSYNQKLTFTVPVIPA